MKSFFQLVKQEFPETRRPWRIIEVVITSDGPRSRLCEGAWVTKEDAVKELIAKGSTQ